MRQSTVVCLVLLTVSGLFRPARADLGPTFSEPPSIGLTFFGSPLENEDVVVALLDAGATARGQSIDRIPEFENSALPRLADCCWLATTRGRARGRIRITPVSAERIQIAILQPKRNLVLVSNAVD